MGLFSKSNLQLAPSSKSAGGAAQRSRNGGGEFAPEEVDRGLELANRLIAGADVVLQVGESVPLLGAVCVVARKILEVVKSISSEVEDVWAAGKRALSVLQLLDLMKENVAKLHKGREEVELCMRELEMLLYEVNSFVQGFGESGWLKRAFSICKVGRKLSMIDRDVIEKMETLRDFYNLAKDHEILQKLEILERIEFRLETEVANRLSSGAFDETSLRVVGSSMGFSQQVLDSEVLTFLTEKFTVVQADHAKMIEMMKELKAGQQQIMQVLAEGGKCPAQPHAMSSQSSVQDFQQFVSFRSIRSNMNLHVRQSFEKIAKHQVFQLTRTPGAHPKALQGAEQCGSQWAIHYLGCSPTSPVAIESGRSASSQEPLFLHVRASWEELGKKTETKCQQLQLSNKKNDIGSKWYIVPCQDGSFALQTARDSTQYLHVRKSWASLHEDVNTKWQVFQLHTRSPDTEEGSRWLLLSLPAPGIEPVKHGWS